MGHYSSTLSITYFQATKTTKVKGGREQALKDAQEADENKEMVQYWFEDDLGSNNSGYYELQAVLTHKGRSSNSGHYVAWVKYKGDTWIECNDDEVRPVHVEDVMKLSGGGELYSVEYTMEITAIYSYTCFTKNP